MKKKEIVIKKQQLRDFFKESILNFTHVLSVENKISEELEEAQSLEKVDQETYMLGVDENGVLIYTESSIYIPFNEAVFFQVLDEEFLENLDFSAIPYSRDDELQYLKELIEAKFQKKNISVRVLFI